MPSEPAPALRSSIQPETGIQWLAQEMRSDAFWRQLPAEIRTSLNAVQEAAIRAVAAGTVPRRIRLIAGYRYECRYWAISMSYFWRDGSAAIDCAVPSIMPCDQARVRTGLAGVAALSCLLATVAIGFAVRSALS
jgi:hypothetical protein